jgi:hypothetical protein
MSADTGRYPDKLKIIHSAVSSRQSVLRHQVLQNLSIVLCPASYGSCEMQFKQRVLIYDCYVKNLHQSCRRQFHLIFPEITYLSPSSDIIFKLEKRVRTHGILIDKRQLNLWIMGKKSEVL